MGLERYLEEQSADGSHESEGVFTLDLSRAAERLTQFRLPSPHHYLLKIVQIASQLGAVEMKFRMERFRTAVHFRAPKSGSVADSEAIYKAFSDPLNVSDPLMNDLVTALLGSLTEHTQEVLWSYSEGHRGRRVFIKDHQFEAKDFILRRPLASDDFPCAYTLSVLHPRIWKFWLASHRIVDAVQLVEQTARFSRVKIRLDGRNLEPAPSNSFIRHRRVVSYFSENFRPYRIASYLLSNQEEHAFRIQRPSTANYVVRETNLNLWASGTRLKNTLVPDGLGSPAWVLRFTDGTDDLSMRQVIKAPSCKALLAYCPKQAKAERELRLTLVRNSVVVFDEDAGEWSERLPFLKGCALILHDHSLPTDLTGFQIIQDKELRARLEALEPELQKAKTFLKRSQQLVRFLD